MHTIEIKKANAWSAWNGADQSGKKLLEDLLGKENVSGNIQDMVKTFDDILSISGVTMASLIHDGDTPDEVAYKQAKLIAKVYNRGRELNPKDTSQSKYYTWHKIVSKNNDSGFGLSFNVCDTWASYSDVGVRLCFVDYDDAVDAGKKFIEIYENLKIR